MLPVWLAIIVISRDVILVFGSIIVYFMQNFTDGPAFPRKTSRPSCNSMRNVTLTSARWIMA
jgi:hypothetical protein